jgi:hypothetical protein
LVGVGNAGTVNLGGGGGSGGTTSTGGAGGSGTVIIAFANTADDPAISGGLVYSRSTARAGFVVYSFTSGTGTINW